MASIEDKKLKIDENLNANAKDLSDILEKRVAHICEKIRLMGDENDSEYIDLKKSLASGKNKTEPILKENEKYVECVRKSVDIYDKINGVNNFYSEFKKTNTENESNDIFFEYDTVVYLKNSLSDIAYKNFSLTLKDARVSYEESFTAVCEEVYYGRAPYCILPIETSEDGRLSGFGNMIRKYELKIVLSCTVESANGKMTKFALLKRDIGVIECPSQMYDGEYLEIAFNFNEENGLIKVLSAADYYGYSLNKIDSIPIYYSEKDYYFDVVFKGNGELDKFLLWLELEMPGYEIIGIYKHIKATNGKVGG